MGLRRGVKVEKDSQPGLLEHKGPDGIIGEGMEEEGVKPGPLFVVCAWA